MSWVILWRQSCAMLVANLKARYRKTIAGFIWVILNPLILYGTQSFVFDAVLRLNVERYNVYLLSGVLPWSFTTSCFLSCVNSYVSSGRLLKSFPVNPTVYLFAQILDNLVNFIAAFLTIGIPVVLFSKAPLTGFLFLGLPMIPLLIATFALSWLLALIQVFFRDTSFILGFGVNILFFITPIFYPIALVPTKYQWLIAMNPMNWLLEPFRAAIWEFNFRHLLVSTGEAMLLSCALLLVAVFFWKRTKNLVYFYL